MLDPTILVSALSIGFFGSTHCLFMCGGIASALSFATPLPQSQWKLAAYPVLFSLGRVSSYALAGALFAGISGYFRFTMGEGSIVFVRGFAGFMLILMGLYIANWWRGLIYLEKVGSGAWKKVSPWMEKLKPIDRIWKAYAIGILWGWLPCGLVYSTLLWSSAAENALQGALAMLFFGLGTLPAMFATGRLSSTFQNLFQKTHYRQLAGIFIMLFGLWTIFGPYLLNPHHAHI